MSCSFLKAFAPGRSEICGNHTDHQGGKVVAATLDIGIEATVEYPLQNTVIIESKGYDTLAIRLDEPLVFEPRREEEGTSASLVRGMLAGFNKAGATPFGLHARLLSKLPSGGGLSSSAAYEMLLGVVFNELYANNKLTKTELARMGQATESDYFGKPCGLMDQLAIAYGGICVIDFANADNPQVSELNVLLEDLGITMCLIDTHCDHSALTGEYALVPQEMQAVARMFGARRLIEVPLEDILDHAPVIKKELGDRAYLRALHFYNENRLTSARIHCLCTQDAAGFLAYTKQSSASSSMYLQNVFVTQKDQPVMVILAHAQMVLDQLCLRDAQNRETMNNLCGAARIHGGGFGGSIQAFVPTPQVQEFCSLMNIFLGYDGCRSYALNTPPARILA